MTLMPDQGGSVKPRLERTRAAYQPTNPHTVGSFGETPRATYPCGCSFVYDACDYGSMFLPACPEHD